MDQKVAGTEEAWDAGELGRDERFVRRYEGEDFESLLNDASDLHPISIRLPKHLIESYKVIAQIKGGGMRYQTLMRQALRRFAECEMKDILREVAAEMKTAEDAAAAKPIEEPPRRAA